MLTKRSIMRPVRAIVTEGEFAALRALYALAKRIGAWPSINETAKFVRRDRTSVANDLRRLRRDGLVAIVHAGPESGHWLTADGYEVLGREPLVIDRSRLPSRVVRNNPAKRGWVTRRRNLLRRIQAFKWDTAAEPPFIDA